jgi:hypothetical protein
MEFLAEIRLFVSYEANTAEEAEQHLENYKEALAKTPKTDGLEFSDYHLSFEAHQPVFSCECCGDGLATEQYQNEQVCTSCRQFLTDEAPAIINASCSCAKPDAPGWHVNDMAGITYGGLKMAQNEASRDAAQYIAHIYYTKTETVFASLMQMIADNENANVFGGYSESCEWANG